MKEKYKVANIYKDGKLLKKGLAVKITTVGAYVMDNTDLIERTDSSEWFPFESKSGLKVVVEGYNSSNI